MANRSYLVCTSSEYNFSSLNENEVVCAANYMVPIFWYMLFDENDLVPVFVQGYDGEPDFNYDLLSTSKVKALSLAKSRLPLLLRVFGEEISQVFCIWLSHIEMLSESSLVLETCELAMMSDFGEFKTEIEQYISAYSTDPMSRSGFFKVKKSLNGTWKSLLAQADISDVASIPDTYKLCGFSWVKNVPWE